MPHATKSSPEAPELAKPPRLQISWQRAKRSNPNEVQALLDEGKRPAEIAQVLGDKHNVQIALPKFGHLAGKHPRGTGSSPLEKHLQLKHFSLSAVIRELGNVLPPVRISKSSLSEWLIRRKDRLKLEREEEKELMALLDQVRHPKIMTTLAPELSKPSPLRGQTKAKKTLYNNLQTVSPMGIIPAE